MRSLSRAVVVGALAMPLAIGGAGLASADGGHHESKCGKNKCSTTNNYDIDKKKELHYMKWNWDWTFVNVSDNQVINAGIINR